MRNTDRVLARWVDGHGNVTLLVLREGKRVRLFNP